MRPFCIVLVVSAAVVPVATANAAVPVDCANPRPPLQFSALLAAKAAVPVGANGALATVDLPPGSASPSEVIVGFKPTSGFSGRQRALASVSPDVTDDGPVAGTRAVTYQAGLDPAQAAAAVTSASPSVAWAEPNFAVSTTGLPNDPDISQQWPFVDTAESGSRSLGDIRAADAWALSTGAGIKIGIVDSGVDASHPDLRDAIAVNPGEAGDKAANGIDDDGDGLVDDSRGWDFVQNDGITDDPNGHGTHVAGVVGARADNGLFIAGLAYNSQVVPARAIGDEIGTTKDVVAASEYAISQGARIVNLSLITRSYSMLVATHICAHPEVLFVAAAGNDGSDVDASPTYPCALELPNVICVAATDEEDRLASFSNHGPATVDISAPGVSIVSTGHGGRLATYSGTSQATPLVAAAAALVLQRAPGLDPAGVISVLRSTADRNPALAGAVADGAMLDVGRAVASVSPPAVRDAQIVSKDGKAFVAGTVVTSGPSTAYVAYGSSDALGKRTPDTPLSDSLTFQIEVPAQAGAAHLRVIATNARGQSSTPILVAAPTPTVHLGSAKRGGRKFTFTGTISGVPRVDLGAVSFAVGPTGKTKPLKGAVRLVGAKRSLRVQAILQTTFPKRGPYHVVLTVDTKAGATATGELTVTAS